MRLLPRQYYTLEEASDVLGISVETLRLWSERGEFPAKRVDGRYAVSIEAQREWFESFLERLRQDSGPSLSELFTPARGHHE